MTHKIIISIITIVAACSLGVASVSASQVTGVLSSGGISSPTGSQVGGTLTGGGVTVFGTVSGGPNGGGSAISGTVTGGGNSVGGTVSGGFTSGGNSLGSVAESDPSGAVLGASTVVADSIFPIGGVRAGGLNNSAGLVLGAPIARADTVLPNVGVGNNQPVTPLDSTILLVPLILIILTAFIVYELLGYKSKKT